MQKELFLCTECGFSGQDNRFGSEVQCPHCRSRRIVLEAAWRQYRPEEMKRLKDNFDKNGKTPDETASQSTSPAGEQSGRSAR
ncbi:MAG: hypothetical protein JXB04_08490 [Kiritimatiellae bacterium]|nr:hypothetical protein [Kiritimatiellia bacterium]